jgi:hypothetical protein
VSEPYFSPDPALSEASNEMLERIVRALDDASSRTLLSPRLIGPVRPADGEVVFADGTFWNPTGAGRGPVVWDADAPVQGLDSGGTIYATIPAWQAAQDTGFLIEFEVECTGTPSSEECLINDGAVSGPEQGVFFTTDRKIRFLFEATSGTTLDITSNVALEANGERVNVRCFLDDSKGVAGIIIGGREQIVEHTVGGTVPAGFTRVFDDTAGAKGLASLTVFGLWLRKLGANGGDSRSYLFDDDVADDDSMVDVEGVGRGTYSALLTSGNLVSGTGRWRSMLGEVRIGAWEPRLLFGGGNAGMTWSVASGVWGRAGRLVFLFGRFILSAKGSSTGAAQISGLPFSLADHLSGTAIEGLANVAFANNMSGLTSAISASVVASSGEIIALRQWGAAGTSDLQDTNFTNTSSFDFQAAYITDED